MQVSHRLLIWIVFDMQRELPLLLNFVKKCRRYVFVLRYSYYKIHVCKPMKFYFFLRFCIDAVRNFISTIFFNFTDF